MALATITNYTFTGSTQAVFISNLDTAMTSGAGFTLLDSFLTSTNLQRVYSYQHNVTTFGTAILRAGFSAAATLQLAGFSAWNTATDTGSNTSTNFTRAITLTATYTFRAINHPEVRGVWIISGSTPLCFIGYLRPANKPTWWSETVAPYFFIDHTLTGTFGHSDSGQPNTFLSNISSLKPATFANATLMAISKYALQGLNTFNFNKGVAIDKPTLYSITSAMEAGQFSEDIVLCGIDNLKVADLLQVTAGVEEYYTTEIIGLGNQAIAVRII